MKTSNVTILKIIEKAKQFYPLFKQHGGNMKVLIDFQNYNGDYLKTYNSMKKYVDDKLKKTDIIQGSSIYQQIYNSALKKYSNKEKAYKLALKMYKVDQYSKLFNMMYKIMQFDNRVNSYVKAKYNTLYILLNNNYKVLMQSAIKTDEGTINSQVIQIQKNFNYLTDLLRNPFNNTQIAKITKKPALSTSKYLVPLLFLSGIGIYYFTRKN